MIVSAPLLSIVMLLPLLGVVVAALVDKRDETLLKGIGLGTTLITMLASFAIVAMFRHSSGDLQLVEHLAWLPKWGIFYQVGVDGISLWLIILTTVMVPLALLGSWNAIDKHVREFVICVLALETMMIGAFISVNVFFFYVFWEAMLIPMYLMIGVFGSGNNIRSANKFFLYTVVGSLLMLVAILYIYFEHQQQFGYYSLYLYDLFKVDLSTTEQTWLFAAFATAFAVKVPLFPLHTWLPDAHVDAPTPGSVILAAILLKMGTYAFLRFGIPLFPEGVTVLSPYILILSAIGIVYGALVAWVQTDIKKLIAYSSVSHMGFVMIGMFALSTEGIQGAVLQMISHGISTGALFLAVGMIYERRHTRDIAEFGGLASQMPIFALMFMLATLSSIGLPGLNGFVGEFIILMASFLQSFAEYEASGRVAQFAVPLMAMSGIVLGAVYMLTLYKRMMFGKLDNPKNQVLKDLSLREIVVFVPLVIAMFYIGVRPNGILKTIRPAANTMLRRVNPGPTPSMSGSTAQIQVDGQRYALLFDREED